MFYEQLLHVASVLISVRVLCKSRRLEHDVYPKTSIALAWVDHT